MRMDECRTESIAAILHGASECSVAGHWISAVDFFEVEVGESRDEARNAAAGGLDFHRHRDRVAVVFHAENDGKLTECRGVHRLPELALTRSSIAQRNVCDLVVFRADVLEFAIITAAGRYFCS